MDPRYNYLKQLNIKVPEGVLEELKRIAKVSGKPVSEVVRHAIMELRLGDGGQLLDVVATKTLIKGSVEDLVSEENSRLIARQHLSLQEAAKAIHGLILRLGGKDPEEEKAAAEVSAVMARIDKMAEWAKEIERRLKALEGEPPPPTHTEKPQQ